MAIPKSQLAITSSSAAIEWFCMDTMHVRSSVYVLIKTSSSPTGAVQARRVTQGKAPSSFIDRAGTIYHDAREWRPIRPSERIGMAIDRPSFWTDGKA